MGKLINRIGETSLAKNGQIMTIIACRSAIDIDVQFEDGTIVLNKRYGNFKLGSIKNENLKSPIFKNRLGATNTASNGQKMTIIKYNGLYDINIKFEDGTIVEHKTFSNFKRGKIDNPNFFKSKVIGEESIATNGQKMKIINYNGVRNIDVQFEDNTIVKHKNYYDFKKGIIKNPNCLFSRVLNKVGETSLAKNGQMMKIINYENAHNLEVEFEDGTVVKNKSYKCFKSGSISNPNFNPYKSIVGKKYKLKNSEEEFEVVEYKNAKEVIIKFDNGFIRHTSIKSIKEGIAMAKPISSLLIGNKILVNKKSYYVCCCKNCNIEAILSVEEINNHKCN